MQSAPIPSSPAFSGDFVHLFEHLLPPQVAEEIFLSHGPRGGGLAKLSGWQWLIAKVFHAMCPRSNFCVTPRPLRLCGQLFSLSAIVNGVAKGWVLGSFSIP